MEAIVGLDADHADLCDEIGHGERIIEEAEAEGVKLWRPDDFMAGDLVRSGSRLLEVLRVNKKTVTVPGGPEAGPITSQANRKYSFNGKLPYDKVTGRVSAEKTRALLAEAEKKAQPGGTAAASGQDQRDA